VIKRILVGVTGTPAAPSKRQYTIDLARRHSAKLEILSVVDVERLSHVGPVPLGAEHFAAHWREDRARRSHEAAETAIAEFEADCAAAGVPARVNREEGNPFEVLVSEWRYNDLTILGLRDWFDHAVVEEPESTLIDLVVRGVRPILAVPETARAVKTALVAYDGSKEAARAMKTFVQMNLWPDVAIHVVSFGESTREAQQLIDPAAAYCRDHGLQATAEHVPGRAAREILGHAARIGADIIVVGCSHHRVLLHRVFGATTLHVIQNADVPVFMSH